MSDQAKVTIIVVFMLCVAPPLGLVWLVSRVR